MNQANLIRSSTMAKIYPYISLIAFLDRKAYGFRVE